LYYTKGRELGSGGFAKVFIGIHNRTGQEYAVKQIDRRKMYWSDRDALEDEISNLLLLRDGPNIVQLYHIYEESNDCFLVMELLEGGELFDRILQKRTFTEKEARDVCKCMLNALKYMHERRVAHRDLKPENLLLKSKESDTELILADFGFAKKVTTYNGCRTLCGTPGYLAPEILERYPAYDTKCDLFSVGVILFVLLGGYLPFDDKDEDKIFDRTRNGDYIFYPDHWNKVSKSAKNLVITLLTVNPSNRASAQLALDHEWMRRTDEALAKRSLSVAHLHQSILAGKGKKGMKVAPPTNRLGKLNEDFESYLLNRSDSASVFTMATKTLQHAGDRKDEDSATGLPFKQFYEVGDLVSARSLAL
jgi:serine/threonine protein kinase